MANCRFICSGCVDRYIHRVLGFEVVPSTEKEKASCTYIKITITCDTDVSDGFFCFKFRSIPTSLISYPIRVKINGQIVPVENRTGRNITTADLYECIRIPGCYTSGRRPKLVID